MSGADELATLSDRIVGDMFPNEPRAFGDFVPVRAESPEESRERLRRLRVARMRRLWL